MMRDSEVRARRPGGMREQFAQRVRARESIINTIRRVYELYGFEPLYTPALEFYDTLRSAEPGSEILKAIYRVTGPGNEDLALRFDLTVPLARVLGMLPELPRPFRRYQVAPVWRGDKPVIGQFREFMQFDLDAVGVVAELGDTEIIAAMCDTLRALRVGPFVVRVSSRRILGLLLDLAGIPRERGPRVFTAIDRLEKIGAENVRGELTGELGLSAAQADQIESFLRVKAPCRADVLDQLRDLFAHVPGAAAEIDALERISRHLHALHYGDDVVCIDPSVARGLGYYTSTVFEAVIHEGRQYGSVFSGGRYDDLIGRFLGEKTPATGASLGIDRLIEVLQSIDRLERQKATTRVFVANLDPALTSEVLALTWELRAAGIATELYLGTERELKAQLKYANHHHVPIVLFYGPSEHAKGVVTVKDMTRGEQERIERGRVVERVADLVKEIDNRQDG